LSTPVGKLNRSRRPLPHSFERVWRMGEPSLTHVLSRVRCRPHGRNQILLHSTPCSFLFLRAIPFPSALAIPVVSLRPLRSTSSHQLFCDGFSYPSYSRARNLLPSGLHSSMPSPPPLSSQALLPRPCFPGLSRGWCSETQLGVSELSLFERFAKV
jgi:hypothetical protein